MIINTRHLHHVQQLHLIHIHNIVQLMFIQFEQSEFKWDDTANDQDNTYTERRAYMSDINCGHGHIYTLWRFIPPVFRMAISNIPVVNCILDGERSTTMIINGLAQFFGTIIIIM
jgi:hypothetical protein